MSCSCLGRRAWAWLLGVKSLGARFSLKKMAVGVGRTFVMFLRFKKSLKHAPEVKIYNTGNENESIEGLLAGDGPFESSNAKIGVSRYIL